MDFKSTTLLVKCKLPKTGKTDNFTFYLRPRATGLLKLPKPKPKPNTNPNPNPNPTYPTNPTEPCFDGVGDPSIGTGQNMHLRSKLWP